MDLCQCVADCYFILETCILNHWHPTILLISWRCKRRRLHCVLVYDMDTSCFSFIIITITHHLSLITRHSPFTCHSLFFTHHSSLNTRHSSFFPQHSFIILHSSCVTWHSSRITHHSHASLINRHSTLITHHSTLVTRYSSLFIHHSTLVTHCASRHPSLWNSLSRLLCLWLLPSQYPNCTTCLSSLCIHCPFPSCFWSLSCYPTIHPSIHQVSLVWHLFLCDLQVQTREARTTTKSSTHPTTSIGKHCT